MRRIQRDVKHEEFIKTLTTGENPIFREIWRVLHFAAAYGVHLGVRKPLQNVESNKAIPENYFSAPGWKGFLYLLGFLDNTTGEHLKKDEEQENNLIKAFEEFANAGLERMQLKMNMPSSALADLTGLMLDVSAKREITPDLTGLI